MYILRSKHQPFKAASYVAVGSVKDEYSDTMC